MSGPTDDVFGGGEPLVRHKSAGYVASGVATTSKAKLMWATVYNQNASGRFLLFFDSATVPANGTAPEDFISVPTVTQSFVDHRPDIAKYDNGISYALSTTADILTLAGADAMVRVYYRGY